MKITKCDVLIISPGVRETRPYRVRSPLTQRFN